MVDGALSGNGKRFQISVRLLDVTQFASPVWSDPFELAMDELHQLDERVTARIVGRIDPVILFIEGSPKRPKNYGATGLLLRAMPLMYSMERDKYERAGELINLALKKDPDNAMVLAWGGALASVSCRPGLVAESEAIIFHCAKIRPRRDQA